eukprot:scaffold25663_cov63-Phaeocystis_antarctica.AAC.6
MSDTRRKHAGTLPKGTVTYRSAAQETVGSLAYAVNTHAGCNGPIALLVMLRRANCATATGQLPTVCEKVAGRHRAAASYRNEPPHVFDCRFAPATSYS